MFSATIWISFAIIWLRFYSETSVEALGLDLRNRALLVSKKVPKAAVNALFIIMATPGHDSLWHFTEPSYEEGKNQVTVCLATKEEIKQWCTDSITQFLTNTRNWESQTGFTESDSSTACVPVNVQLKIRPLSYTYVAGVPMARCNVFPNGVPYTGQFYLSKTAESWTMALVFKGEGIEAVPLAAATFQQDIQNRYNRTGDYDEAIAIYHTLNINS